MKRLTFWLLMLTGLSSLLPVDTQALVQRPSLAQTMESLATPSFAMSPSSSKSPCNQQLFRCFPNRRHFAKSPFGVLIAESGSAKDVCPFRFMSKYYDAETSLYYFGYRYYDPASTKWLSRDPLQEQGGINLTQFCGNDPVNNYDSLGLDYIEITPINIAALPRPIPTDKYEVSYVVEDARFAVRKFPIGTTTVKRSLGPAMVYNDVDFYTGGQATLRELQIAAELQPIGALKDIADEQIRNSLVDLLGAAQQKAFSAFLNSPEVRAAKQRQMMLETVVSHSLFGGAKLVGTAKNILPFMRRSLISEAEREYFLSQLTRFEGRLLLPAARSTPKLLRAANNETTALLSNSGRYPPNGGFLGGSQREFLMPGTEVDRFGFTAGKYVSPRGTLFGARGLPPEAASSPYSAYKVVKPIEVNAGVASPSFGQAGLGMQYEMSVSLDVLLKRGLIEPIP